MSSFFVSPSLCPFLTVMVLLSPLTLCHFPLDVPFPRSFLTLFSILHSFLHLFHALTLPLGPRALRQNLPRSLPSPSFPEPSSLPRFCVSGHFWVPPAHRRPDSPGSPPPPGGSHWAPGSRASLFVQRRRRLLPALFAKLSAPPRRAGPIKSHSLFSAPVRPRP